MELTFAQGTKDGEDSDMETKDNRSMSTAAFTTYSTRLALRQEKAKNDAMQEQVRELEQPLLAQSEKMAHLDLNEENTDIRMTEKGRETTQEEEIITLHSSHEDNISDNASPLFESPPNSLNLQLIQLQAPRPHNTRLSGGNKD